MKVLFHPGFPRDVRRFQKQYSEVSATLAERFRDEVDAAVESVKVSPTGAGHFLGLDSEVVPQLRRKNLRSFPFFLLYGIREETLVFGSVIPVRSDPLTWLARFRPEEK